MKKLWGARFRSELHETAKKFTYSLGVDHELLSAEIKVSMAHALMLGKVGIISERDSRTLVKGLWKVLAALKRKNLCHMSSEYEDIHTLIQAELEKKVGKLARRLHTGRSRNDLVATSMRVYLKEKITVVLEAINQFQLVLVAQAERNRNVLIPGYTHLQRAQVVSLGHYFLAYVEMLERDKSRFVDARKRMNECPLGAGALAGSTLPIDRAYVAKLLGFQRPTSNSLDSVSDRDFVIEVLSSVAILFTHLSRFSEDLVLWASQEFGFISLDDQFATGSSLMPHKKNPDVLELVRGKTGQAYGNLISVLVTMKGLPLAYNRDMQEDKMSLFASLRILLDTLAILNGTVRTIRVDQAACERASKDSFLFATDLLEYLVKKKVPFLEAHQIVGALVRYALDSHTTLGGLSFETYQKYSRAFKKDVFDLFDPKVSISSKVSSGSPKPELVAKQIRLWKERLKAEAKRLMQAHHRGQ
ncbi:MAG: argininosuccinate lyase [Candidatus Omnitrophica bacterium]|nr:argininosuccinate lyase [Candidatus Omnitrophota bacterium]